MKQCTKCGGSGLSLPVTACVQQTVCSGCHGSGIDIAEHSGAVFSAKQLLDISVRDKMIRLRAVGMINE